MLTKRINARSYLLRGAIPTCNATDMILSEDIAQAFHCLLQADIIHWVHGSNLEGYAIWGAGNPIGNQEMKRLMVSFAHQHDNANMEHTSHLLGYASGCHISPDWCYRLVYRNRAQMLEGVEGFYNV
jgi:hypothetical protein